VGEVAGYEGIRERMVAALPDFLRRNIRGQTDSELLFHLVLSFLHDGGHLDAVDVAPTAVAGALRSAAALADSHAREVGATPGSLSLALSNGRQLYAMRRGSPLCLASRDRLAHYGNDLSGQKQGAHQAARYVVVSSYSGQSAPPGYRALVEGEVIGVDRDLQVSSH
jgi:hypothetical protein